MCYTKGINVRNIKNFDKIKSSEKWIYFEKFTKLVNDNAGNLSPSLYIDSLIDFFKGYFNLKLLSHLKGIKIYKLYLQQRNNEQDYNKIYKQVKQDLHNIVNYICVSINTDLHSYVMENHNILPTIAKHFNSGTISKYTLALIPDIKFIIASFPEDIQQQFFYEFINEYKTLNINLIRYPKLKQINDNFEIIIKKMLLKSQTECKNLKNKV